MPVGHEDLFAAARAVLAHGLAEGAYAGAEALVVRRDRVTLQLALGEAQIAPVRRPLAAGMLFDLASLTKVVAGTTAVLLGLDRGWWRLDDPVARFIPRFAAQGKGAITLRHLLTHTSGLPAWTPLYLRARTAEDALPVLCGLPLEGQPGTRVAYSDLGMALVAYLVRAASGLALPDLLARELFGPLGMDETCYLPGPAWRDRCVATACGNEHEAALLAAAGQRFEGWRRHVLVGEVHDGNTHYALEGISSHAGLFGTARDLVRLTALYLHEGACQGRQILGAATVFEATRCQTAGREPRYGLGWRLVDPGAPHFLGERISECAYGHTGFTGTSLAIDPARDLAMILLTNAVHTDPGREGINRVRPAFHDAVCAAVDGITVQLRHQGG